MAQQLRVPQPLDAQELAALHVQCWIQTYTHLLPAGFFDARHAQHRLEMWQRVLADPNPRFRIRVAENAHGQLVGFGLSAPCAPQAVELPKSIDRQLYNLYVLQDFHGDGTGQALLDAVLGQQPALLWVATQNPRAIRFYERNGFTLDGVTEQDPAAPKITDARMLR